MPVIRLRTFIQAPIEVAFDLARSIDLHAETMSQTEERAVEGVTSGLIGLDETVTWEAVHFWILQRLTSKITVCKRPEHLQDVMVSGAFASLKHDHYFSEIDSGTLMEDVFDYKAPLGLLGNAADLLFLERYMTGLLTERNRRIKQVAEGDEWRRFIPDEQLSP